MDCAKLTAGLGVIEGYEFTVPPAGPDQGWCVLDGAALRSTVPGWPNLSAAGLRLRGEATAGVTSRIDVELTDLRIAPQVGDTSIDDRLRALFRLQTIDLRLSATHDAKAETLLLSDVVLELSGGTELSLVAKIDGADLSPASLAGGALTELNLVWRNDGRLLRPVMEAAGERLVDGAVGSAAVDAARLFLGQAADNLPETLFLDESRDELDQLIATLPQGRGQLVLAFEAEAGIGATELAISALSGDPLGPQALSRLFAGATIEVEWRPGLTQ